MMITVDLVVNAIAAMRTTKIKTTMGTAMENNTKSIVMHVSENLCMARYGADMKPCTIHLICLHILHHT